MISNGVDGVGIITQADTTSASTKAFALTANGALFQAQFLTDNSNKIISSAASGQGMFNNTWRHIVVTVAANDCNIYMDGSEVSYQTQDNVVGAGFSGVPSSVATLTVAQWANGLAGEFFDGRIDRIKVWEGTTLTDAQVLEEFNNEGAAAITLTPSKEYTTTLNSGTFTENGTVTYQDDLWNPNAAVVLNGTDAFLTSSEKPFDSSEADNSFAVWATIATVQDSILLCQHDTSDVPGAAESLKIQPTTFELRADARAGSSTNRTHSEISSSTDSWDTTDTLRHFMVTIHCSATASLIRVYMNGVEFSSYGAENTVGGTGCTAFPASGDVTGLAFGSYFNGGSRFFAGVLTRPKFWKGDRFSEHQVLAEYNAEVAAQGEGLSGDTGNSTLRLNRNISLNSGSNLNTGTNLNTGLNLV
jgi:hypothetical protein